MRFAITLTDRFKVLLDIALQAGWQPLKIFTSPLDGKIHDNRLVIEQAARLGIPVQLSPITEADLAALATQGCETLLLGSYDWRVPNWRPHLAHAVNFHPSPLPEARGPFPLVRAILEQRAEWGVSCHVVEQDFDSGALLDQQRFAMAADETLNTLEWKCQLALEQLGRRVIADFPTLWQQAQPQGPGSYWPRWSEAERTLDLTGPLASIQRQLRAFGDINCLAEANGVGFVVHRAQGWLEPHAFKPGTLVRSVDLSMLFAVADGFLVISEWSVQAPGVVSGRRPF